MRYTFADLVAAAQAIDAAERLKAELAEFAAEHFGDSDDDAEGVVNFLDITTGDAFNVPFDEAIAYFKNKGLATSFSYTDMIGRAHDQAFTVAKMLDVDLLKQVRDSLESALANGQSFNEWKKGIVPIMKSAGWWGRQFVDDPETGGTTLAQLGSAWRLDTIFRTNMQTAYAAGQWQKIWEQSEIAPYLMYDAIDDLRTRAAHREWDKTILPFSSPWWKTHYPPNGWNCRCGVIQLDESELRAMGMKPSASPPDDGTYAWENSRTGERFKIPNGIDPGFNRNVGDVMFAELRKLLEEKVANLPASMQVAIAPVIRRQFDTSTAAGKWHAVAFDDAPDWLRNPLIDSQHVDVQTKAKRGAWARGSILVEMDGYTTVSAYAQSVWRHEFGHVYDARRGVLALYRSSHQDFLDAQKADADRLAAAAGNGRKSRANDKLRDDVVKSYDAARQRIVDADLELRPQILRDMAVAAGIDFDSFVALIRQSTLILDDAGDLRDVGKAVRIANMIEAVRTGDGEGFLRNATFLDRRGALFSANFDPQASLDVQNSWEKDGSLASLSDLIGSATRNRAANYHDGFSGHSNDYYRKWSGSAPTESFANLMALAGHPNSYWWTLTERFAPQMASLFREIMEGKK